MNTIGTARKLAFDLLSNSPCNVQMAAVISDQNGVISWGWNRRERGKGMHAEHHAIICGKLVRMRGATLTVVGRRRKSRSLVYSRPCDHNSRHGTSCLQLAQRVGIGTIEYVTKSGTWKILELRYVPGKERKRRRAL